MDLGFARRKRNHLIAAAIPLDYHRLLARLAADQAASPTGRAAVHLSAAGREALQPFDALVALFDPEVADAAPVGTLGGSFHPWRVPAESGIRQPI